MIITTTDTIDGYRIIKYLGIIAISKDPKEFFGGIKIDKLTERIESEAIEKYGAETNAIVGLRFFKYDITSDGNVMAYGTAVKIEGK